jgi:hypothetical protein
MEEVDIKSSMAEDRNIGREGENVEFRTPCSIIINKKDLLYVVGRDNSRIQKLFTNSTNITFIRAPIVGGSIHRPI